MQLIKLEFHHFLFASLIAFNFSVNATTNQEILDRLDDLEFQQLLNEQRKILDQMRKNLDQTPTYSSGSTGKYKYITKDTLGVSYLIDLTSIRKNPLGNIVIFTSTDTSDFPRYVKNKSYFYSDGEVEIVCATNLYKINNGKYYNSQFDLIHEWKSNRPEFIGVYKEFPDKSILNVFKKFVCK